MRISDWSSDVCSSDLGGVARGHGRIARGVHPLELRARHVLVLCQFPIALVVGLGLAYGGLARVQLGAGCIDLGLLFDRTQAHQHGARGDAVVDVRSEEHTSELQSLMRISYAVFCLKKKNKKNTAHTLK